MELRITAFKGSPWQAGNTHEAVVEVRGRNAQPDKLLGAHLVFKTETGRVIRGKVVKRHGHDAGNKLVARFHKGLPGQAIGQTVEVREAKAHKVEKRAAVKPAKVAPVARAAKAKAAPKLKVTQKATGKLTVSGTQFDAPGPEAPNLANEWVELTNGGTEAQDLTGWSVKDEKNHVYKFPAGFTLQPGKSVKVRTGIGTDGSTDLYWG
ncbi:MAG: 50S ribosomal protein L35ae, partial [Halobacteriales archaeon]|nr:50S ribosomal protein L35ae [Halobacteriales archaeon]